MNEERLTTKEYFEKHLDERFDEQHRHMMILFEKQQDTLQLMMETISMHFESNERRIIRSENKVA